jgi:N-hydroxyarylamine O-acetyltransferase
MDAELQAAYLRRLGLDAVPPSVEALQRLHRRHVERVPYETMWIHLGEAWGIDLDDAVARIAGQGRGGYCFHLNGALSELLRSLGYAVTRHVGGVHGPDGPDGEMMSNHLVLTVSGLPASHNPSGTWYVDAGLGDASTSHCRSPRATTSKARSISSSTRRRAASATGT